MIGRLREEAIHRCVVLIDIVDIVRVELRLVVVEVEVERLVEITIGFRIFAFVHLWSPSIKPYFPLAAELCVFSPEFYPAASALWQNPH